MPSTTPLLLHMNGSAGSTSFPNSGTLAKTATVTGVTVSTTTSKFGGGSAAFNGTNADLSYPAAGGGWDFGTGDFTVEGFVYFSTLGSTRVIWGDTNWVTGNSNGWHIEVTASGAISFIANGVSSVWNTTTSATFPITTGEFHHIAVCRLSGVVSVYVNGAPHISVASAVNYAGANPFRLGAKVADGAASGFLSGYIDELRITKGASVYTGTFTNIPTSEFRLDGVDTTLPTITAVGYLGGSAAATLPALHAWSGVHGVATMGLLLPPISAQASLGGSAFCAMPSITLSAAGRSADGENAVIGSIQIAASAYGGANATAKLPALSLSTTGVFTGSSSAAVALPQIAVSATGTVSAVAQAAATLPNLGMVGFGGAVISATIGGITVTSNATTGAVGVVVATLPMFDLQATATAQDHGGADILLPALGMVPSAVAWAILPGMQLTAIGTAVVAVTYEAYALNLKHQDADSPDELTRYTNFPFDKIVRYQNSYFGMNSTGLYLLEGTTDFAEPTPTPIPWSWKTALTDFDSAQLKTVNWAYFGGRLGPAATVSIHFGDTGQESYSYASPRGASAQNYRQAFGRGIKSRYYAFEAEGSGELSLDSLMFDIAKSARKV